MNWNEANDWANNLVYGGYDDWQLPAVNLTVDTNVAVGCDTFADHLDTPQYGYNSVNSEIGHLFYVDFGGTQTEPFTSGTNQANLALFTNLVSAGYWMGPAVHDDPSWGWFFSLDIGYQDVYPTDFGLVTVAVRPGDVVALVVVAAVPEPQTPALALLALGATVVARNRRPR